MKNMWAYPLLLLHTLAPQVHILEQFHLVTGNVLPWVVVVLIPLKILEKSFEDSEKHFEDLIQHMLIPAELLKRNL